MRPTKLSGGSGDVKVINGDDAEEEDEYFEFNIHVEPLTGDVALIITDFADEDEVNDTIELWNKQMDILHRNLGA